MFNFLEKKRAVLLLIGALSILGPIGAGDFQSNEYEVRLKQAEKIVKELVIPKVAAFDLHNNTDLKKMTLDLIKVAKDSKIHGILLWIDSNGGGSAMMASIHDTLLRIKKFKPVVVLVRGNVLSGAYHIASAADYIFAHSESLVGSIGTVCTVSRYKNPKVNENGIKADLDITLFTGGKYKAMGNRYGAELTEDEKSAFQREVNLITKQFINDVAQNRNLYVEKADQWADARTFIAHEAVELGLIDEVGTAFEAEVKMVELIRKKNLEKLVKGDVEYIFFDCVAPAQSK